MLAETLISKRREFTRRSREITFPGWCPPQVISKDKNGVNIASIIGKCDSLRGAPPKGVRHMSEPARRIAAKYSSESCKYVLPPTTKAEALEPLKAQLSLISSRFNWVPLVNDRHSNFATTMAQFSTQARRTPSGLPLQNHLGNPFRTFHQVFDELMESFDGSKSTGFENRIRPGHKSVWMATNEARAHLMYRTICKLLLTVAGADEIQSATPHELVYTFMVKDATEVFVKEEAHSGKKQKSRKWRLIWALSSATTCCASCCWARLKEPHCSIPERFQGGFF